MFKKGDKVKFKYEHWKLTTGKIYTVYSVKKPKLIGIDYEWVYVITDNGGIDGWHPGSWEKVK